MDRSKASPSSLYRRAAFAESVWADLEASACYSPYEPKVVIALVASVEAITVPPPYETESRHRKRILVSISGAAEYLPSLTQLADNLSLPEESVFILCPTTPVEVESVARNWYGLLQDETWVEGEHGTFIGFEVGDDWNTFSRFLGAEVALWEAIHRLLPSKASDLGLKAAHDARDLGDMILAWMVERGRGRPPVSLNALCDIGRRTMVFEKRHWLHALINEIEQ